MKNHDFIQIKEEVLNWSQRYLDSKSDCFELIKNEEQVLMIDLSFPYCLARIDVCNQSFAPYKNVCFEALGINSSEGTSNIHGGLVYFFYDSKEMTIDDIIEELDFGFNYCLHYIPNMLERKYIQKKGKIKIKDEKLFQVVHPDDIEKIDSQLLDEEFVCVDVQFQYLVVEKETYSIRVLPRVFNII